MLFAQFIPSSVFLSFPAAVYEKDNCNIESDNCLQFLFSQIDSSLCDNAFQHDSNAFIFSPVNKPGWASVKMPRLEDQFYSTDNNLASGPGIFEIGDIHISNDASSNNHSYSDVGCSYRSPGGYTCDSTFAETFLVGSYHFTPDEEETFYKTN